MAAARPQDRGASRWFADLSITLRLFVILGVLFAAVCAFFAKENWRGRRAWENYRRQLEARGVELDWTKFIPPPVPDEQNFAMTPFLAPLFDFNPKPRSPEQPRWRDMEARDRAANFAAALLPANNKGEIPPTIFDGHMTDLEGALSLLRSQTNSVWVPGASNRIQAATAVLAALEPDNAVLEELQAASRRPQCRFNVEYDAEDTISILLPHYMVLQRVTRLLQVRASAELALGKPEAAFKDVNLMFSLGSATRGEPFLISGMASGTMLKRTEQILWEGLAGRQWSEAQLQDFQARLTNFAILKSLDFGLRAERAAFGNTMFRYVRSHKHALRNLVSSDTDAGSLAYLLAGPDGWFYQEQAAYHRLHDERVLTCFDPKNGRVFPQVVQENKKALEREFSGSAFRHHTGMSKLLLANLLQMFQRAAIGQERLDQTIIASALERYRLANGKYPASLQALLPQFAGAVPVDVCDGQPLRYRLLPDGGFALYGVGWNEKDDGGTVVMRADGSEPDPEQGDWVWPAYPKI
jgi:hypothetical protein